jgi:hypothetical protein
MRSKLIILVAIFFAFTFSKAAFSADDGDFQYWNTESFSWKMGDDWKGSLEEEFRFSDDAGDFTYQHSDLSFTYSGLADWLDVGVAYRHVFEKKKDGSWPRESRPHLNATIKGKLDDWAWSCRGRLEYRDKQAGEEGWRYRNKVSIKFPFKFTSLEIQPYVADEIFIDLDGDDFNRNRVYAGFSMKLFKNLKAEIYYLWQNSKKSGDWNAVNVLGTKLKFSF